MRSKGALLFPVPLYFSSLSLLRTALHYRSERLEQATNHSEAFAAATWTLCYKEGLDYYGIVVLFDCYQRQSIKAMTKSRRSKNIPQIVGRVIARREVPLQVFLALGDKKAHLARSLSDERIAQAAGDTTIVLSGGCSN